MNYLEENKTENTVEKKDDKNTDTQNNNQKEMNFGKFANAQALFSAYQSLEKEFTKKSQQLKELKKQYGCDNDEKVLSPQQNTDNFATQNPTEPAFVVDNPAQANDKNADEILADKDFMENHVFNNPKVANEVLQRYLMALSKVDLPQTINGKSGAMSLTPPKKPQTLKEASVLAKKLFK
ncbi:MAG: hypothetical protein E7344_01805 [Clostridiales bacterium]|nr:hypothetical protein [Clostridiales bacterium]